MAMRMLEAGGVGLLTDEARPADESNPKGYYEYERVKELDRNPDTSWLTAARGRAIKVISFLLPYLPETSRYRVVFMQRDMSEIVTSQNRMLSARGASTGTMSDDRVSLHYRQHLEWIDRWLTTRPGFEVLRVTYGHVLQRPHEQAERIATFLDLELDVARMAAAVDGTLYRIRQS
jgi:hypothetical protein